MRDSLPASLTRHDLLKTLALVLMLVDHIGFFFFPGQLEWRMAGRASAPIWLFLVGYNHKSHIDMGLLMGAAVMLLIVPIAAGYALPLNILVTIILVRLTLPLLPLLLMPRGGFGVYGTVPGVLMLGLAVLLYPTHLLFEYGVFAWLFAAWGWWQREAEDKTSPYAQQYKARSVWVLVIVMLYSLHYAGVFRPDLFNLMLLLFSVLAVTLLLLRFRGGPAGCCNVPLIAPMLRFCGRQSMLLYVVHYLLLGVIAKLVR